MPVLINAAGEHYLRTTDLPSIATFTMMAWVRRTVDLTGAIQSIFYRDNGSDTQFIAHYIADNILELINHAVGDTGSTLALNTWTHVAMTKSGNDYASYVNAVLDQSFTDASAVTNTRMLVGADSAFSSGTLGVDFAGIKIWDGAALTAAEILSEMHTYWPVRSSGIHIISPLFTTATDEQDWSGNARAWTVNGTPSDATTFPPLTWRHKRGRQSFTAGGLGTINVDGALISQSSVIAGDISVIVGVSGALASQSATIVGTVSINIDVSGSLLSQASQIAGAVNAIIDASGALLSQPSSASGNIDTDIAVSGALLSQSSLLSGDVLVIGVLDVSGVLQAGAASMAGNIIIQELPRRFKPMHVKVAHLRRPFGGGNTLYYVDEEDGT